MKVAIQGIEGSYHHEAVKKYFKKDEKILGFDSFWELTDAVKNKIADLGLMAIENSIAGTLLQNINLIEEYNLEISGEVYVPINHCLSALKGQKIEDIKKVYSHPMAIRQCRKFFQKYPHITLIESPDTADSVKKIKSENILGAGAIASETAAEYFGLEILAKKIQTIQNNATRFIVLERKGESKNLNFNKATIKFSLKNEIGSLSSILNMISNAKMNMTKIQSVPVMETPWKYSFFIDVIFDKEEDFKNLSEKLNKETEFFTILGTYKRSQRKV